MIFFSILKKKDPPNPVTTDLTFFLKQIEYQNPQKWTQRNICTQSTIGLHEKMDLAHNGKSDFLILKTAEKNPCCSFAHDILKNISTWNDTTGTKCPKETCFRDNEFSCTLSIDFYGFQIRPLMMFFFIGMFHKLSFIFPWDFSKQIPQNQD